MSMNSSQLLSESINKLDDSTQSLLLKSSSISPAFLLLCIKCKSAIPFIDYKLKTNQLYVELKCNQCKAEEELKGEEYIDLMKNINNGIKCCTLRKSHSLAKTEKYCLNCRKWICETCYSYHQLFPALKDHSIHNKEILIEFSCRVHSGKRLKMFCNDCKAYLCKHCQAKGHQNHSVVQIDPARTETDSFDIKKLFERMEDIRIRNRRNKEAFINLINLEIEELNKIKQSLQSAYEINQTNIKAITDLLQSANDNYSAFKSISYEVIANLRKFIDYNKEEPDISSSDLKKNCLSLVSYYKTNCFVKVKKEFQCISSIQAHNDKIFALIQLKDGRVASGSWDKTVKVWNIQKAKCEVTIKSHSDKVFALAQLKDGKLCSGSRDKTIKVWDITQWTCLATISGHTNSIFSLAQLKDGRLGSVSADQTLKLWDMTSYSLSNSVKAHSDAIYSLIELKDSRLASASSDKTIKLWRSSDLGKEATLQGHSADISILLQLSNGNLASGSKDKTIIIWDIEELTQIEILRGHRSIVFSLLQLKEGTLISGTNQDMLLWNVTTKKPVKILTEHDNDIRGIVEMDNGLVVTCSDDRRINLWQI